MCVERGGSAEGEVLREREGLWHGQGSPGPPATSVRPGCESHMGAVPWTTCGHEGAGEKSHGAVQAMQEVSWLLWGATGQMMVSA